MGMLVDGAWVTGEHLQDDAGRFVRRDSAFRDRADNLAENPERYRLFVSLACPWAHRTLIYRALMGLQDRLAVTVVAPVWRDEGWAFADGTPYWTLYRQADPGYTGKATVPVLWDEERQTIVNNESAEIIRMLDPQGRFRPEPLRAAIDEINGFVYERINNGVYRTGFATSQAAYEEAFDALFEALDRLEARLARTRYLLGEGPTEADWRLFPTLVRFDAVYHGHFKCNRRRLVDYPNLWAYTRDIYQTPGVGATVDLDHIKRHYYASHTGINPTGIVPKGPEIDFEAPHRRG